MNVLLIGSGGREHALAWKIAQSPMLKKLYAAPGNAGIASLGECVPIKADDIESLVQFAKEKSIDLTVVGPEAPLANGIVDRFEKEQLLIFGPNKIGAQLEGSKVFAKTLMKQCNIPTADFKIFDNVTDAKRFIVDCDPPMVIKADGLAQGKGVIVANSCEEGILAVNRMIEARDFGDAGRRVIVEECLTGEELSVLVLTDGERMIPLASSQDHKRAFDADQGPNTGGMGAYSPALEIGDDKIAEIVEKTAKPVIDRLRNDGILYRGLIYVGIMMTAKGPYVLEYNVRFGDPETQAVLPRLKTDLLPILHQIAKGRLETLSLEWDPRACLTVVMASEGYPGVYKTGFEITGLDLAKAGDDVHVFHAGTSLNHEGKICTAGGRVLSVSALGTQLKDAYDKAYAVLKQLSFKGAFCRFDIGKRAILKSQTVRSL